MSLKLQNLRHLHISSDEESRSPLRDLRWVKSDPITGAELDKLVEKVRPPYEKNAKSVLIFRPLPDFVEGEEVPWYVQTDFGYVLTNWFVIFNAALWVGPDGNKISFWLESDFSDDEQSVRSLNPYMKLNQFLRPIKKDPTALPVGFRPEWLRLFRNETNKNQDSRNFQIPSPRRIGLVRAAVVRYKDGKNDRSRLITANGRIVPDIVLPDRLVALVELSQTAAASLQGAYDLRVVFPDSVQDPVGLDKGVFIDVSCTDNSFTIFQRNTLRAGLEAVTPELSEYRDTLAKKVISWDRLLHFLSYEEQAAELYKVLPADLLDMAWADYPDYRAQRSARPTGTTTVQVPEQTPSHPAVEVGYVDLTLDDEPTGAGASDLAEVKPEEPPQPVQQVDPKLKETIEQKLRDIQRIRNRM